MEAVVRARVKELYRKGYPLNKIAEYCNIQLSDVEIIVKEFGLYI